MTRPTSRTLLTALAVGLFGGLFCFGLFGLPAQAQSSGMPSRSAGSAVTVNAPLTISGNDISLSVPACATGAQFLQYTSPTLACTNCPAATASAAGCVSTATQTLAGDKTFNGAVIGAATSSQFQCSADAACEFRNAGVADGAGAVTHTFSSTNSMATAGAQLASFRNFTNEKLGIGLNGELLPSASAIDTFIACGSTGAAGGALRQDSRRRMLFRCDSSQKAWLSAEGAPHPAETRVLKSIHNPSESNNFAYSGWQTNPTITDAAAGTNAYVTDRSYRGLVTTAVATGNSRIIGTGGNTGDATYSPSNPRFEARIRWPVVKTNQRLWFGFVSAALNAVDSDTTRKCAVRFSTVASDTVFQLCSADGTTQTCTPFATAAPSALFRYHIVVDLIGATECVGYIAAIDDAVQDWLKKTTNLPATGFPLLPHIMVETTTTTALTLGVNSMTLESQ